LITALSYNAYNHLIQITDPSGRWIKISRTENAYLTAITRVDASDGQWVKYNCTAYVPNTPILVLSGVQYSDGTSASYSYQDNTQQMWEGYQYGNAIPLPKVLLDCRAAGPMQKIAYEFAPGQAPGTILREKKDTGEWISSYSIGTHTETRGDFFTRQFAFSGNQLQKRTDFKGQWTTFGYNSDGFVTSVTGANGQTTHYDRLNGFGAITKVTHPDGSYRLISYTDNNNPYWVAGVQDENGHLTKYTRDGNNRVTQITDQTTQRKVFPTMPSGK
jgi:YD repeat-containing protein